jgi:hypothetical protein
MHKVFPHNKTGESQPTQKLAEATANPEATTNAEITTNAEVTTNAEGCRPECGWNLLGTFSE